MFVCLPEKCMAALASFARFRMRNCARRLSRVLSRVFVIAVPCIYTREHIYKNSECALILKDFYKTKMSNYKIK